MRKPLEKMTELEKLQHENAELKKKIENLKFDSNSLRWSMMSEREKDVVKICYKMLVKEDPSYVEWNDFKNDFMEARGKYYVEKNFPKNAMD